MKTNHKIWLTLLAGASLAGCADQDIDNFYVEKPASIAQYEYLNVYGNLKDYLRQRSDINPNFKLGAGVAAADYNKFGQVYRVTNANFDQITAGNAMKYASIVNENGEMDFGTVKAFVDAASKAGIEVYGHTLCWHEQQTVKYLNGLIADRDLPPSEGEGKCLHINTPEAKANPWDWQNYYDLDTPLKAGVAYKFSMRIKSSAPVEFPLWIETPNAGNTHYGIPQLTAGKNWEAINIDFTPNSDCSRLLFNFGKFGGDLWFDDMVLVESGSDVNLIKNGDFEGSELTGWSKPGWHSHSFKIEDAPGDAAAVEVETEVTYKTYTDGPFPFFAMGCEPPVINGCIHFVPTGDWSQFFILPGGENTLTEGDYVLYLDLTASKDATGVQLTMQNGWGGDAQNISVSVPVSAGQNTVRLKFSGVDGGNYDVILKPQTADATLDVRSVKICKVENLNKIPLSPEEKAEVLTAEMERWVKGMMEATAGQVKAWDVVNEAISGGPWGQRYDLQHAATASGDQSNKFYWQDYLGDNFVRVPVKFARQYFAENGGNPDELKLFINDYNLESDWDDNQKLKSLIQWIEQWESDGETRIDGIGSQMHVSYHLNPATQASKEEHVVKMFELMAASGKLVRITELDMGICDENGNAIKTADVTFEQQKAMGEYYRFIIEKYFEIIPTAQQYGICQWAQTDSPEGSGWRPGEPIGLWDLNFSRKPTYGGFADGLAGKRQE